MPILLSRDNATELFSELKLSFPGSRLGIALLEIQKTKEDRVILKAFYPLSCLLALPIPGLFMKEISTSRFITKRVTKFWKVSNSKCLLRIIII